MKATMILGVVLLATQVQAKALLECKATEILNSSILEESLSVEEYPEITIRNTSASLGASTYKNVQVKTVQSKSKVKKISAVIIKAKHESFRISYNKDTGKGTLSHTSEGKTSAIAKVICAEPLADLKNAWVNDLENVRPIADIPEEVTKAWDEMDFGLMMGDGYYSQVTSAQFGIYKSGKLIGYMNAGALSYTEDPEHYVAYTVSDLEGNIIIEMESYRVSNDELESIREELRPTGEE